MQVRSAIAGFCLTLAACDTTQGPLLVAASRGDAESGKSVRAGMSLQYQLTGELNTRVAAQLFVTDLFDTDAAQLAELHAAGRIVSAYLSAGSLESWRQDAATFPSDAVGQQLSAYPNERWLDIRRPEVRSVMQARFELAVERGFDGVLLSTLGVYRAESGFEIGRDDELAYATELASDAHGRNLSVGLSGDFELSAQLAEHCDWALAIRCVESTTCDGLRPLSAAGLPVFDLETTDSDKDVICSEARSLGIPVTFKHDEFDAYRDVCP